MDIQQAKRQQQSRQQWAGVDPFTLCTAAKSTLYAEVQGGGGNVSPEHLGALEEVISRFEQQTRASLGAGIPVGVGQSTTQQ